MTVLVLRALGLGDALTGVAALRGVRRAFPDHRIVLAAPSHVANWLRDLAVVDDILPTPGLESLRWSERGHVAVDLHGPGPESHRVLLQTHPDRLIAFRNAEAGYTDGPWWREDEHEVLRWCRLVRSVGGVSTPEDLRLPRPSGVPLETALSRDPSTGQGADDVVLHPGAASGSRRWPAARWAQVATALAARGRTVVLTGGPTERDLCARIVADAVGHDVRSLAGDLDLPGLADVVARARLLVCGDTGVAHLATAFGTRSVLLFGPTPPQWSGPAIDHERHVVLWHGHAPGDPRGDQVDPALAAITPEEVLRAAAHLLA